MTTKPIRYGEDGDFFIFKTRQSRKVAALLCSGKEYIADINQTRMSKNDYRLLMRALDLHNCPIFGFLRDNAEWGESHGEALITVRCLRSKIKITEFYDWTDFLFYRDSNDHADDETYPATVRKMLFDSFKANCLKDSGSFQNPQIIVESILPQEVLDISYPK